MSVLELNVYIFTILDIYSYSVQIIDTNGQTFSPNVQDVESFNSSTSINKFQTSGSLSTNASKLTAIIKIK